MQKTVSDMIFDALTSSPDPLVQQEALLNVSKGIAESIRYVQTGMSCQQIREKGDADHV